MVVSDQPRPSASIDRPGPWDPPAGDRRQRWDYRTRRTPDRHRARRFRLHLAHAGRSPQPLQGPVQHAPPGLTRPRPEGRPPPDRARDTGATQIRPAKTGGPDTFEISRNASGEQTDDSLTRPASAGLLSRPLRPLDLLRFNRRRHFSRKGVRKICNAAKHEMLLTAAQSGCTFLDVRRVKETPAQSLDQRTRSAGFKRGPGQPSLASDG
jgi:hypothetical protein